MSGHPRARSEEILSREVGDELVVYSVATKTAYCLRKDAAAVWRRCDGDSSVKDIAGRLGLEQARVEQALEELSAAELIEEPEGISRRALYKRAATLGAAAVSAPLIYSLAIRTPSANASSMCAHIGTACTVTWENGTCTGSPNTETCVGQFGPTCTCQNLSSCVVLVPNVLSQKTGTCA